MTLDTKGLEAAAKVAMQQFYENHTHETDNPQDWENEATEIIQAYLAAASDKWLQDAVIVLDEGAEPMEGDVVEGVMGWWKLAKDDFGGKICKSGFRRYEHWWRSMWTGIIKERAGKPVVYRPKQGGK